MADEEMAGRVEKEANGFDEGELSEVLSLLPPYEGRTLVELSKGVSPFTGKLAAKAGQLLVVDLTGSSKNDEGENVSGNCQNVKFTSTDAASLRVDVSPSSVDLIFADGLLMYLSDKEVQNVAERMVGWLKPGAFVFLREPCLQQIADANCKSSSAIQCRELRFYIKVFKDCQTKDESGKSYELSLVDSRCTGGDDVSDQTQVCRTWQKVQSQDDKDFQRFLDNVQYKSRGILRYERVFGSGFVSTGGIETTREFVSKLGLKAGQKVLDVGCGIGGGDFYMAENFGVEVVGIDLSINMISIALERAVGLKCAVKFEVVDCTKKTYPEETFDVIYSRDTILHIQDKPALFRSFYKWLKPGGKVLISDYCKRAGKPSPEFSEYIKQRGYDLHDVQSYGQMLKDAGFNEVLAEDRTDQFLKVLEKELDAVEKEKDSFICDFSEEDYKDIVEGWKAKLIRSSSGEQRWGLFIAKK